MEQATGSSGLPENTCLAMGATEVEGSLRSAASGAGSVLGVPAARAREERGHSPMTREPNADDVITNEAPGGRSLWRRSRSPHPPSRTGLGDLASSGHHPTWSSQERSRARTAGPERRALWVFASNARFGACGTYVGVRYGRVALLGSALMVTATAESSPSWCGRSNTHVHERRSAVGPEP